jgi:cytochrome b
MTKQMANGMVRIWDPAVRVFHWSLAAGIATAWLTGDEIKWLHEWVGYAIAALVSFRVAWGLFGPRYARFGQFVPGPGALIGYVRDILSGHERRYLGHNPAGGAMIVILLACVAGTAFTGWLQTTDAYFGDEMIEEVHAFLANGILVLIALHVGGVLLSSIRHRENLVRSMITGSKRAPEPDDVI